MTNEGTLSQLFTERSRFVLIGLTGRTGSGCSTAAGIFSDKRPPFPTHHDARIDGKPFFEGLSKKRYNVARAYAEKNWKPFYAIKVSDLISAYMLDLDLETMVEFIVNNKRGEPLRRDSVRKVLREGVFSRNEVTKRYGELHKSLLEHDKEWFSREGFDKKELRSYLVSVRGFTKRFKMDLRRVRKDLYVSTYQAAGTSIRKLGEINVKFRELPFNRSRAFHLAETINRVIKLVRLIEEDSAFIVIDAIRNPYEARFFRDRYSAFYLMSVNAPEKDRREYLMSVHKFNDDQLNEIDEVESGEPLLDPSGQKIPKDPISPFIDPDVKKCIEIADIHLVNPREELNNSNVLLAQIAWYFALMVHPGLISPTSMERVMQIAFTARVNSGCISRQVGAAITDQDNSIKAIGWNDVPSGQYPCSLRSVSGLLNEFDPQIYSEYERTNIKFRSLIRKKYGEVIASDALQGRTLAYCFKQIQNEVDGKGNQVFTRSLHAEENAFLQLTKYGGAPMKGGKLYTTASPCELCAKKAYQLGIREVVYIDPYPGIAKEHILAIGSSAPKLTQFVGAVGRGYHQLYEQTLPYKDELEYFL